MAEHSQTGNSHTHTHTSHTHTHGEKAYFLQLKYKSHPEFKGRTFIFGNEKGVCKKWQLPFIEAHLPKGYSTPPLYILHTNLSYSSKNSKHLA